MFYTEDRPHYFLCLLVDEFLYHNIRLKKLLKKTKDKDEIMS